MTTNLPARLHSGCMRVLWMLVFCVFGGVPFGALAQDSSLVHGMWVWKAPTVLKTAHDVENLRDFCSAHGVNEVYVSVSERGQLMPADEMARMIDVLHRGRVRVEALFSSENADEGGAHLEKLLGDVRTIVEFNRKNPQNRFDGIHLDIEPQQRQENKGAGNLGFLPGLVEAYSAIRGTAEAAGLTVDADIQTKLLKGELNQRRMLLTALPRLTLMMYEVSSATDGDSAAKKGEKAQAASEKYLAMAYQGLAETHLAKMIVALRTPDYGAVLEPTLQALDAADRTNPHYLGWARHSYNDTLPGAP